MSKKPHPLEGLNSILGSLKDNTAPPSPALAEPSSRSVSEPAIVASNGGKGRPATGKKSNEDYCQTTISIRKETRKRVKQALLDADAGEDVSELVEKLLVRWLDSKI